MEALSKHVGVYFKYGGPDTAKAMLELQAPVLALPSDPDDKATSVAIFKWEKNYAKVEKKIETWEENNKKVFNLVLQHSTPEISNKIESLDDWATVKDAMDGIELLKLIRKVCH